jgi:hypothetical protein
MTGKLSPSANTPLLSVRIYAIDLGSRAMGIRTPDLLHAISRQAVHGRTSAQVTVLTRAPECALVRAGCGTSVLSRPTQANRLRCHAPRAPPPRRQAASSAIAVNWQRHRQPCSRWGTEDAWRRSHPQP